MRRFLLKKLIVISSIEEKSREIVFKEGLNIVIGENKTGKSSLIKMIFYILGGELLFEEDWLKVVDTGLLFFSYEDKNYLMERKTKKYNFFETDEEYNLISVMGKDMSHAEMSKIFMKQLGVTMSWHMKNGDVTSVSPQHLLTFQYIDQDKGWDNIGKNFKNLDYIKNWQEKIIKYITGYQDEHYFRIKNNIEEYEIIINESQKEIDTIRFFLQNLQKDFVEKLTEDREINSDVIEKQEDLLKKMTEVQRDILRLNGKINELNNKQYEQYTLINYLKFQAKELIKDHDFVNKQDTEIKCPFCGTKHENSIVEKYNIITDIETSKRMISNERENLNSTLSEREKTILERNQFEKKMLIYKNILNKVNEETNIINTLKQNGREEIVKNAYLKLELLEKKLDVNILLREKQKEAIEKLISRKRHKEISEKIRYNMNNVLGQLTSRQCNKLRDFRAQFKATGSDSAKFIYAYFSGLYLYQLEREDNNIFKFLVIDTVNQRGQDLRSIENIHLTFKTFLDMRGQVIIGTERDINMQAEIDSKINYIKLTEKRRCLNSIKYKEHIEIIDRLRKIN